MIKWRLGLEQFYFFKKEICITSPTNEYLFDFLQYIEVFAANFYSFCIKDVINYN